MISSRFSNTKRILAFCQDRKKPQKKSLRLTLISDFTSLKVLPLPHKVFRHCPTLMVHADNVDKILESWRGYKMAVPTYGAIILDPTLTHVT